MKNDDMVCHSVAKLTHIQIRHEIVHWTIPHSQRICYCCKYAQEVKAAILQFFCKCLRFSTANLDTSGEFIMQGLNIRSERVGFFQANIFRSVKLSWHVLRLAPDLCSIYCTQSNFRLINNVTLNRSSRKPIQFHWMLCIGFVVSGELY